MCVCMCVCVCVCVYGSGGAYGNVSSNKAGLSKATAVQVYMYILQLYQEVYHFISLAPSLRSPALFSACVQKKLGTGGWDGLVPRSSPQLMLLVVRKVQGESGNKASPGPLSLINDAVLICMTLLFAELS